ncbi:forkhead box protein M1-like [Anguilla anguilla]|uniref:forkhead box protein M1-like n=1 Tax=Anguilla anguilla TaxID=7936 RepID=UPI0015AF51E9|nr:forkhead box protein M1-like [Anguilla anguilla]XP_035282830.1 forkhead box protein M1-like [Anguilla anguilla]XP_035282831.1 forkhead box protein M1-like [Anguilla anguilla]XP_035282832.1 forkhead box protein M1-like [Anguilla anguilla]
MKESPRRPLILKRRKLPFPKTEPEVSHDEPDGLQNKETSALSGTRCFPNNIRIIDHPTLPDTQVVVIPKTADLQSVLGALTAKGKECGPLGPNKFILLSGGSGCLEDWPESLCVPTLGDGDSSVGNPIAVNTKPGGGILLRDGIECIMDANPPIPLKHLNKELDCNPLDDSLTNIQWLGGMSTDGLAPNPGKKDHNKENQESCPQLHQPPRGCDEGLCGIKDPQSERPPYSYMAMIQFAINSKKNRRMTLKEIYTWIEDHFTYFRNVAKPGWKNSIRHNLSLHDMFIRETSQDGKISYWTIRPEANRCLTLDQVYKPVVDLTASTPPQTVQVCEQQPLKRVIPEVRKAILPNTTERKMKPLLPRTDSYLVPIQLPLAPSLFLPSAQLPLAAPQPNCSSSTAGVQGGGKRVRIAPKVLQRAPLHSSAKKEAFDAALSHEFGPGHSRKEVGGSRRKQRLATPSSEEPVLLYPDSTLFDSGLASDLSAFQDTQDADAEPKPESDSPCRGYAFKTPIKSTRPASSTPSKPPATLPESWRLTPLGKEGHSVLDFSPIRTPRNTTLTPQRHNHTPFSFSSTPFKDVPLFSSPRELLTSAPHSPPARSCSRELQVGGAAAANRSLTEGLILDTMNDSLSKILVDISFSGLDDEELGMANISWSQLIPELK